MKSATKAVQDGIDPDFVWGDYLEETKSTAAPPTAFSHVEYSLENGLKIGMKLEVANHEIQDHYWVASVVMTCGPLLSLRYVGYGADRSADFWLNVKTGEFHPVGWCNQNNRILNPPRGVRERHQDFKSLLTAEVEASTIPAALIDDLDAGITPVDQIKCGMKVEIHEDLNPQNVWPATIIQNVGGRLLLRYEGSPATGEEDFWLFYLSQRIHPIRWYSKQSSFYCPPKGTAISFAKEKCAEILALSIKETKASPFPVHVLEPQLLVEDHGFKKGMKLEVLDPATRLDLRPATVIQVINAHYFLVRVDNWKAESENLPCVVCCHSNSQVIFPCNWAKENGLKLKSPDGYNETFDWDEYLSLHNAVSAPNEIFPMNFVNTGFDAEMKLEAVNPFIPSKVHAATVEKIIEPLMWIRIDSANTPQSSHVTTVNSFDIFPVGWCASNGYPLHTPTLMKCQQTCAPQSSPPLSLLKTCQWVNSKETGSSAQREQTQGKSWCPKIYFNHRCFSGPLLSKSRLAELPQAIGPGPVDLVMKDVLTRLINIAYKSSRVLRELQISGKPDPNMQQQTIKAKYKGKSYRATVEFVRNSEQVDDFCRKICTKLDCCPHLFGPNHVGEDCPDNCYTLTKTKFGHNFLKKQKKSVPTNLPVNVAGNSEMKRGPGRKKKRKHWRFMNNNASSSVIPQDTAEKVKSETKEASPQSCEVSPDSEVEPPAKKKLKPSLPPKSGIVTRGAKLPNFGLELHWRHHRLSSSFHPRKVGRPPLRAAPPVVGLVRKVGRPLGSTKKMSAISHKRMILQRAALRRNTYKVVPKETIENPFDWTVEDVVKYVKSTECAPVAPILRDQEIDGQALLMLTMYSVQEFLHLKLEPAKCFCSLVERLKIQFFTHFSQS